METIRVAQLGEGDVFLGLKEIPAAALDERVHVPAAEFGGQCDLPDGRYYWNRDDKRFYPVPDQRDQELGTMIMMGLVLADAHQAEEGRLGDAARAFGATARRRFRRLLAMHERLKKAS